MQTRTLEDLGKVLRDRRRALGVTAADAAAAAGVSRVTWYRLERGEPGVATGSLAAAAAALGLTLRLGQGESGAEPDPQSIPLLIRPRDWPVLERLAWQLAPGTVLDPREAYGLYRRNWRHVEAGELGERERTLLAGLETLFGPVDV